MSMQGAGKKESTEESPAAPDSTTKERSGFSEGEDVLQRKDGQFYLGTIVEVDLVTEQCLIKFGDDTDSWSSFKDLTKLTLPESDLLCVICKKSQPKTDNEIIVCDKCSRGYHHLCHQPHISKESTKPEAHWVCKRCLDSMPGKGRESKVARKESIRKMCGPRPEPPSVQIEKNKLPYDPDELSWDQSHRSNIEQRYCYCGKDGDWFMQMLQCGRCRQWFHEKCIKCLQYPLYCGDRFYVFVCSLCNYGKEFVRRLEMKWVDIVHLALFNLTIFNTKKYYDLDTVIIPYVNDNWHAFQLPPKILDVSLDERRENILSVLTNNRNRFKCGREIKKRTTIWGLRVRLPPHAPSFSLPSVRPVSDALLKELWFGNKRLKFLPPSLSSLVSGKCQLGKSFRTDGVLNGHSSVMKSAVDPSMMGSVSSSMGLMLESHNRSNGLSDPPMGLKLLKISSRPNSIPITGDKVCIKSSEYCSGGFVKKSTAYPPASRLSMQQALLRRRFRSIANNSSHKEHLLKRRRYKRQQADGQAKEFTVRKARKLLKNAIATVSMCVHFKGESAPHFIWETTEMLMLCNYMCNEAL
ncbi:hypothetical protein B7P43_G10835 [Cryptotermes secundus]|uniref:PHD-type domain-containing protein n=1 Tax=Cryptotermes secundus TaxID=105785 RepID=A0A2J7PJ10_9NEOP|nr:hypothetical protein B7P43_G10835 [Cryptotermes secundus]